MSAFNARRVILVDDDEQGGEVLARRLRAQGYRVETARDGAVGADLALRNPPSAVVADLWMPGISGVQLCQLLGREPATSGVPVLLRGPADDPRSRFWAERAGAVAYVSKGRTGELARALLHATATAAEDENAFFMQLSGEAQDIHARIARHLDAALFQSVIVGEVRALASAGSLSRLFDLFAQFYCQVQSYRWLAVQTWKPDQLWLHCTPAHAVEAELEARAALVVAEHVPCCRIEDGDAHDAGADRFEVRPLAFAGEPIGRLAIAPTGIEDDWASVLDPVARELGGVIRMATLVEESHRLASTDMLTGLANRRALLELLGAAVARAERSGPQVSVVLLDIDHFKLVNDQHGHAAGDRVLAAVGEALRLHLRGADMPARWGGEELVAVLPDTGSQAAAAVAERLRVEIERLEVRSEHGERIPVTASFGVASYVTGDSVGTLTERADAAMYEAKRDGRNRVCSGPPKSVRRAS
jgi:two-component system cell cycle response regulator